MRVRVAALIIQDNKLLTMKYNYGGVDLFNLPGGNLEFGEEKREALARELQEELCIEVEIAEESALIAEVHNEKGDTLHILYEAKIAGGELQLNPDETSALAVEWVSLEEDFKMYPDVKGPLKKWRSGELKEKFIGEIEHVWL
ncbi:NUDIX domain-containing protein [Jiulongibacter sp. NS-SX5]|uniref:NUDIX domain-containing protein n=1 Tax=Jiulongibacter sp. NS-SX5 TaxID=3463854 RepID=UPI004058CC40